MRSSAPFRAPLFEGFRNSPVVPRMLYLGIDPLGRNMKIDATKGGGPFQQLQGHNPEKRTNKHAARRRFSTPPLARRRPSPPATGRSHPHPSNPTTWTADRADIGRDRRARSHASPRPPRSLRRPTRRAPRSSPAPTRPPAVGNHQIPIAPKVASGPRGFLPWRLSDAGPQRRSLPLDRPASETLHTSGRVPVPRRCRPPDQERTQFGCGGPRATNPAADNRMSELVRHLVPGSGPRETVR